jgi:hypothetical protein
VVNWRKVCQQWIDIAFSRAREYRIFRKSVRKYVDDEAYGKICEEYNRLVTEYRKERKH